MTLNADTSLGSRSPSPRRSILVVEDELIIRMVVADELRDSGYDVIEALNADEALTILRSPVRVDLIFSDVRMPGSLDGLGLLTMVRKNFPDLPVIITSGHLEPSQAIARGANHFIAKPCAAELVVDAVRDLLTKAS